MDKGSFFCLFVCFSSVQFSRSVMFDSLRPHELQHARLPCPSPIPRACSNSCPLSRWCHPTISSSAAPFSFCPQPLPASGSFPISWPSHQVAKVFELSLSNQWIFRVNFLQDCLNWSPSNPSNSQVHSELSSNIRCSPMAFSADPFFPLLPANTTRSPQSHSVLSYQSLHCI